MGICLLGAGGVAVAGASEHETEHEHPDEVRDDGDLEAVQRWLGDRMTEIQINCAENLSVIDSVACDRLDEEYPEYLSEYASVERERTNDDETAKTYEEAGEQQGELVEERETYEETYEEYQEAREAGDEERARELARELQRHSARIIEVGEAQVQTYEQLEQQTGRDYDRARDATRAVIAEIRNTTVQVEEVTFTPTELSANADSDTASFTSPATISGTLTDENGTRLADRTVALSVDGRTVATTRTDSGGNYEVDYRPVATETGPTTVEATYRPSDDEVYLESNATVEVDVESVEPSASIETDVKEVAFGDPVPVETSVAVEGEAAASALVVLFLGDEQIARNRTGENGSVTVNGTVPATVPDGERELRVRVSRAGTALDPVEETAPVTVLETETELTIDGLLDRDELVLSGQLTTADGRPLPNQSVGVNVDAEVREISTTNDRGRYAVRIPRETGGNAPWDVSADYEESESNLGPSTVSRTLEAEDIDTTNGTTVEGDGGLVDEARGLVDEARGLVDEASNVLSSRDGQVGVGVAVAILALVAVALLWRRLTGDDAEQDSSEGFAETDEEDDSDADEQPLTEAFVEADTEESPMPDPDFLEVARQRLLEGVPSEAVRIGYGAVRRELLERAGSEERDTRTHWEFYREMAPELSENQAAALESLTEAYERAAFAPSGVTEQTAVSAVEAAAECLEESSVTDGGTDAEN